ncbi:MAG: DNA repair protein RadC [Halieaceae bacterium]|jgi:DNA repair protein RadC|nr:DNA repair protein RadC [Halieaceae bacterium]
MPLSTLPVQDRPREKLLLGGPRALSDAELLAVLLGTGGAGRGVLELSAALLQRFGGWNALLAAAPEELLQEPGVGAAKCSVLQAAMELARRHAEESLREGAVLTSPARTRQFLQAHLRDASREVFCCLFLNAQHGLIRCEDLFLGTLDGAAVYPRVVLQRALQLQAAAVIFAHNHPSGVAEPSAADRRITERLQAALALVDIRVLDHIIVGQGAAFSFAEDGLL